MGRIVQYRGINIFEIKSEYFWKVLERLDRKYAMHQKRAMKEKIIPHEDFILTLQRNIFIEEYIEKPPEKSYELHMSAWLG